MSVIGKTGMTPAGKEAVRTHAGFTGKIVESRNWWRWAFVSTLPVLVVMGGANAWMAVHKPPVEVFAVVHDSNGRIEDVIKGGNFAPNGKVVAQRLADWIGWVRVASPDRTLQGRGIERARSMSTDRGWNMLAELFSRDPDGLPENWDESRARMVTDIEVTEESKDTFSVAWMETTFTHATPVLKQRFRGTIVVRRITYGDDKTAFLANPIGAFVDTVSWQVVSVEK